MNVRPATLDDLGFLVHGNREMARETEGLELDEVTLRAGVRAVLTGERPATYRVLEIEGEPVAQLMITYEWSDWRNRDVWWIQSVWVAVAHRRRGAYRRLYDSVVSDARAAGAAGIRLYVDRDNHSAQAVYEALGMNGEHYRLFESME